MQPVLRENEYIWVDIKTHSKQQDSLGEKQSHSKHRQGFYSESLCRILAFPPHFSLHSLLCERM